MKKKLKLSFELLEKEFTALNETYASTLKGGNNSVPMPEGFCVFNAMSYCINGSADFASDYVEAFEDRGGTFNYAHNADGSTGAIISANFTQDELLSFVQFEASSGCNVSTINGGISGIQSFLNQNNGYQKQVMATIYVDGRDHEIVITSVNPNGTYNYHDPTDGNDYTNVSNSPTWVMGLKSPLYAGPGSSGSTGY